MLRDFIADTGPELIGIGTTLFFLVIFVGILLRVLTRRAGSYERVAHLPLEDATPQSSPERFVVQDEAQDHSPSEER